MSYIKDQATGTIYNVCDEHDIVSVDELRNRKQELHDELSQIDELLGETETTEQPTTDAPAPQTEEQALPQEPEQPQPAPETPAAPVTVEVNGQSVPLNADGNITIDPTPDSQPAPQQPAPQAPVDPVAQAPGIVTPAPINLQ